MDLWVGRKAAGWSLAMVWGLQDIRPHISSDISLR
jgi:hypothetical protein